MIGWLLSERMLVGYMLTLHCWAQHTKVDADESGQIANSLQRGRTKLWRARLV